MNDAEAREHGLVLEYELEEPVDKVWRALSIPAFRAIWLPESDLSTPDACSIKPGEEVSYRMRDDAPPFLESTVTFRLAPNAAGGTDLTIIHRLADTRLDALPRAAANANSPLLALAA